MSCSTCEGNPAYECLHCEEGAVPGEGAEKVVWKDSRSMVTHTGTYRCGRCVHGHAGSTWKEIGRLKNEHEVKTGERL